MKPIYLDNAATTAIDPEVLEAMHPYLYHHFGNPSAIHSLGRKSKAAIEAARKSIALLLNCSSAEIFFTSGGTESNNTILWGAAKYLDVLTIITSPIEHHCVLHTCEDLLREGLIQKLLYVNILKDGSIDYQHLEKLLQTSDTKTLVTLMHANNELGTLLDLDKVADICRAYNAYFHTDSVQSLGQIKIDMQKTTLHFLTGSAHKFHGPKGAGILYMRNTNTIKPMIQGGSQERNMRAGTENVYGIIGLAKALEIAYRDFDKNKQHITELKQYFILSLKANFENLIFNGPENENCLHKVLSVAFPDRYKTDLLLLNLDINGVCASSGSACSSGSEVASHVLQAINLPKNYVPIRFSFSKFNTLKEIDDTISILRKILL